MDKDNYVREITRLESIIKRKTYIRFRYEVGTKEREQANDSLHETFAVYRNLRNRGKKAFGFEGEWKLVEPIIRKRYLL